MSIGRLLFRTVLVTMFLGAWCSQVGCAGEAVAPSLVVLVVALVGAFLLARYTPTKLTPEVRHDRLQTGFGTPLSSLGGPRYTAGSGITINPTTGVISASGGSGGYSTWSAGSVPYSAGMLVKRGQFLFGCETTNSIDPCFDFGDLTDASLWQYNNCFAHNAALGWCQLIAGSTATTANMIAKTATNGTYLARRLIVDASISGSADAFGFGIFDGSASSTQTGAMGNFSGTWGVELDMYNAQILSYANGVVGGSPVSVNAGLVNDTNAGNFVRWVLDFIDNGATITMKLYRQPSPSQVQPSGSTLKAISDDLRFVAQFTGITKPSFTNWKYIITARTGGAAGDFRAKLAQAVYLGSEWSIVGRVPMSNVQKA